MSGDHIEIEGDVVAEKSNGFFEVKLDGRDSTVAAQISGRMRNFRVRIIVGDRVRVRFSPYDLTRAQIVYRSKK